MSKRLELVWPRKGEHVLRNSESGKWEFCGNSPILPRPLIEIESFGDEKGKPFDLERSNLLIKGENLYALQSLLPYYAGKVKLIYIDPPFNTGQDFEAYDDNFEHSVWLSLMAERLEFAKLFLREDGYIFVHIDNKEIGNLKVLMDRIFGERNFVQIISEKRASPAGFKTINPGPLTVTDYIVMYAKNKKEMHWKPMYVPVDYDENYDLYIKNFSEDPSEWKFKKVNEIIYKQNNFKNWGDAKKAWGNDWKLIRKSKAGTFALENADRVVSIRDPHKPSETLKELLEKSRQQRDKIFIIKREDKENAYIINGGSLSFYSKKVREINGELVPTEMLTDLWIDMNYAGIAEEGGVQLKNGKKPEMLLKRIIEMSTEVGDLVLDYFAGSGTTGAVAHKLNRKWIMVELNEQAEDLACQRLKRVVAGKDQTGISKDKDVDWHGKGGFRFFEIGAPLLLKDPETMITILNPKYTNGPLVRAVCAVEGFLLTGDKFLHGKNGSHYAYVTEDFVDDALIRKLKRMLKDGQFLTIYAAKGVKSGACFPKGVEVKRINHELMDKYLRSK